MGNESKTKRTKSQVLLHLLAEFENGAHIEMQSFCTENDIETLTFHRYISELRTYFSNYYLPYEIRYNKLDNIYYLIDYQKINNKN